MKNQFKTLLIVACLVAFSACKKKDCPAPGLTPNTSQIVHQLQVDGEVATATVVNND